MLSRGGLVSDAVPLEHGALPQPHLSQRREGTSWRTSLTPSMDIRRLHRSRLVVYADAQERKVSQLQAALDSRVVVERAIGILAERFGLPFAEAFELLRSAARNSRREVKAIAQELGTSRKTPAEVAELLPSSNVNDAGA